MKYQKRGILKEYIQKCDGNNTLYVADCFFCLDDRECLHFFYNPSYYWDRVSLDKITPNVLEYLRENCGVIENVSLKKGLEDRKPKGYYDVKAFKVFTPRIGNEYYLMGNRILTHRSHIYLISSYYHIDNIYSKKNIKDFDERDLNGLMSYSVTTNTPEYIKSIYDLHCFETI